MYTNIVSMAVKCLGRQARFARICDNIAIFKATENELSIIMSDNGCQGMCLVSGPGCRNLWALILTLVRLFYPHLQGHILSKIYLSTENRSTNVWELRANLSTDLEDQSNLPGVPLH